VAAQQPKGGGIIEGINVTPLVDITLVLLIIFIVTAKMVVSPSVPLDLPQASNGEEVQTIFSVSLPKSGELLIDGQTVAEAALVAHAKSALAKDKELRAVIQADGDVPHRRVISVLDRLKEAGLTRVAFGTVQRPGGDSAQGEVTNAKTTGSGARE
jgi:biopolymer transport protein TolR